MGPDTVLVKTDQGRDEIESRRHGLAPGLRRALILVDGRSTVAQLIVRGGGLALMKDALEQLYREGYVAEPGRVGPPADVPAAGSPRDALLALARELLGDRAARVVKKLEDSGEAPDALAATVSDCHKLIRLAIDEAKAEEFSKRASWIIGTGK